MNLSEARKIAHETIDLYGLVGWKFKFDSAKRRFGLCQYLNKTISLSHILTSLNEESQVRETILHEVAHALVGKKHGHGPVWKSRATQIGSNGLRCYDSNEIKLPPKMYTAFCRGCDCTYNSNKRNRVACKRCCRRFNSGEFTEKYLLCWEIKGAQEMKKQIEEKTSIKSIVDPMLLAAKYTRKEMMDEVRRLRPDFKDPSAAVSNAFRRLVAGGEHPGMKEVESVPRAKRDPAAPKVLARRTIDARVAKLDAWASETSEWVAAGFKRIEQFKVECAKRPKLEKVWP